MKKMIVLTLLTVVPAAAHAFPEITGLETDALFQKVPNEKGACVDFSGNWKGSCTYAGKKFDGTTQIKQQGCSFFQNGSESFIIGGMKTETDNGPIESLGDLNISSTSTADWNADQTALEIQHSMVLRLGKEKPIQISARGVIKQDMGKLVIDFAVGSDHLLCGYEKQP